MLNYHKEHGKILLQLNALIEEENMIQIKVLVLLMEKKLKQKNYFWNQ